jgi:hypothetical protein
MGSGPSKQQSYPVYPGNPTPFNGNSGQGPVYPSTFGVPAFTKSKKTKKDKKNKNEHGKAASFSGGFMPFANQSNVPMQHQQQPMQTPTIPMPMPQQSQTGHNMLTPVIPGAPPPVQPSAQGTPGVPRFNISRAGSVPSSSGHGHNSRRAPTPFIRVQATPMQTPSSVTPMHYNIYPPPLSDNNIPGQNHNHNQGQGQGPPQPQQPEQYTHAQAAPVIPAERPPSPPNSDIFARTRPHTPPHSNHAYGPPPDERGQEPLMRPLPEPPRDLYEYTPYKNLLSLPETTALIEQRKRKAHPVGPGVVDISSTAVGPPGTVAAFSVSRAGTKKKSGGLFRGLSSRKHRDPPETKYIYMSNPASFPSTNPEGAGPSATGPLPASAGAPLSRAASVHSAAPSAHRSTYSRVIPASEPWYDEHKIYIDHNTPYYSSFLNHSPHRVMYRNMIYPTATHLFEAMKFIDDRPDRAEIIRNTESVEQVFRLSEGWVRDFGPERAGLRPDWATVFLSKVCCLGSMGCMLNLQLTSVLY